MADNNNNNTIPQLRNVGDLKMLLQRYGGLLTPENQQMISSLVGELEKGTDPAALARLAGQMQQSAARQQQKMPAAAPQQGNGRQGGKPGQQAGQKSGPNSISARSPQKLPPRRRPGR